MQLASLVLLLTAGVAVGALAAAPAGPFESDLIKTSAGDLRITFVGHGTLMMELGTKVIHADPVGRYADYSRLPKADLILVTHHHSDHLDVDAIAALRKPETVLLHTALGAEKIKGGTTLANGQTHTWAGIKIEAVPAYNLVHKRDTGEPFHPKGEGNGYVLTVGDKRIYVAGDTEDTPEMKALRGIAVAFLPMNLPYTMTPEMVAAAAEALRPAILYPYHYGNTDTSKLVALLKDHKDIEVRIRKLE
jgi:L-ascorbate metabolism protein UlaG (beta-lactamase superfamily)